MKLPPQPDQLDTQLTGKRGQLWPRLVEPYADFTNYQSWTTREIPVVILDPR